MTVTASGLLSVPLDRMRSLLSRCGEWQTWIGTDEAGALARTFLVAAPVGTAEPFALIDLSAQFARTRQTVVGNGEWRTEGGIVVYIRDTVTTGDSDADAVLDFYNHIGELVTDIERIASTVYLSTDQIEIMNIARTPEEERGHLGDHIEGFIVIRYRIFR